MGTKYLDERIKQYEDWEKNRVLKFKEKLELIELKELKEFIAKSINNQREFLIAYEIFRNEEHYHRFETAIEFDIDTFLEIKTTQKD